MKLSVGELEKGDSVLSDFLERVGGKDLFRFSMNQLLRWPQNFHHCLLVFSSASCWRAWQIFFWWQPSIFRGYVSFREGIDT